MLAGAPLGKAWPNLLVGRETSDDAAVYRLNESQALVATTDFFAPIVDDPYDFGRIAATNAISDVYAMGARPIMALALLGVPLGKLPTWAVKRIVAGGHDVCEQVGVPIAGGHSIDAPEPLYGLVALGLIDPAKVKRNDRARAGDVLILGKGLGIGVMGAALKKGELKEKAYRQMVETATQLNTPGLKLAEMGGVHALTDVTGFGLLGHLLEILRGSKLRARLEFERVPLPQSGSTVTLPPAPTFPCVVKPLGLSGSRGVIRADSPAELASALERDRRLLARPRPRGPSGSFSPRARSSTWSPSWISSTQIHSSSHQAVAATGAASPAAPARPATSSGRTPALAVVLFTVPRGEPAVEVALQVEKAVRQRQVFRVHGIPLDESRAVDAIAQFPNDLVFHVTELRRRDLELLNGHWVVYQHRRTAGIELIAVDRPKLHIHFAG